MQTKYAINIFRICALEIFLYNNVSAFSNSYDVSQLQADCNTLRQAVDLHKRVQFY